MEALEELLQQWGIVGLMITAFTEAAFFVIPPDVVLVPLSTQTPSSAFWFGAITVLFSVLGALFGYLIGNKLGIPVLHKFVDERAILRAERLFSKFGVWALIIVGITPIPFKVFAILGGVLKVPLYLFIIGSFIGRFIRFMPISIGIYYFGDELNTYAPNASSWWMLLISVISIAVVIRLFVKKKSHDRAEVSD
ncbi:DedA family protein [Bacillus sp. HMF5848]|uniref:YqaA family protein n=1 Tax=Bacillus sp. HMF5848 TaxID=2495421 RepID=UPI000F7B4CD4|nr:VTT domain-containing protein [Bacillus sp. HMF5848]RSK26693.1 DedA family protein [Bacillus sp. HMF5848]